MPEMQEKQLRAQNQTHLICLKGKDVTSNLSLKPE